jgi:hypothetical protein
MNNITKLLKDKPSLHIRIEEGLEKELKRQKIAGKKFINNEEIDNLINDIIKSELGDHFQDNYNKKLIDLTDEDALLVVKLMNPLCDVELMGRFGILELNFEQSFKKYGDCFIKFKISTWDHFDQSSYSEHFMKIQFHHDIMWFAECSDENKPSNYNKNHYLGYKKLEELGYVFPTNTQW